MTLTTEEQVVLQAIDRISSLRNRPNLQRIVKYLKRVYSFELENILEVLGKLVADGIVVEVYFKGCISYRNVLRWKHYSSYIKKYHKLSHLFSGVVGQLVLSNPDYLGEGIPKEVLVSFIKSNVLIGSSVDYIVYLLMSALKTCVLVKNPNGNFFLSPKPSLTLSSLNMNYETLDKSLVTKDSEKAKKLQPKGDKSDNASHGPRIKSEDERNSDSDCLEELPDNFEDLIEEETFEKEVKSQEINPSSPTSVESLELVISEETSEPDYTTEERIDYSFEEEKTKKPGAKPKRKPQKKNASRLPNENTTRKGGRMIRSRTKYDPSEYVFPSLKRKKKEPSEFNTEPKNAAARKKKRGSGKSTPVSPPPSVHSPTKAQFENNHIMKLEFPQPNQCLCVICNCLGTLKTDDVMLSCSSCTNKAHSNCIKGVKDPNILHWLCSRCDGADSFLTCSVCDKGIIKFNLASCSYCHSNYHKSCHSPPIEAPIDINWRCYGCPPAEVKEIKIEEFEVEKNLFEPTRQSEEFPSVGMEGDLITIKKENDNDNSGDPFLGVPVDPSIPDPSGWSPLQVRQYFEKFFSKEVAAVFQEQDIDGKALLLMRRSDVLQGLGFKVGIALKVLYHVKKFQIRRSDLRLLWTL